MKRWCVGIVVVVILVSMSGVVWAAKSGTTIQDGLLQYQPGHYLAGQSLKVGYDIFGYNYQAHMYRGNYANVYLGGEGLPPYTGDDEAYLAQNPSAAGKWYWPWRTTSVEMQWNDAWTSNMDRDGDGQLDRHYGFPSYIGSGAWETNHQTDVNPDGSKWNYFVKIVAAPATARLEGGDWVLADGRTMGYSLWGQFAVILDIYNDPANGYHGPEYKSPAMAGFGAFK